ncbi:MAG: 3'-5' exoribonuclease YhaM family protein [bacterium]
MAGKTQKATVNDETLFDNGETGEGGTDGRISLGEMSDGQAVAGAFGVRECQVLQKKTGEDYVKMTLADASSSVTALSWDRAAEFAAAAKPGSVVFVEGKFSVHPQFGRQIKLSQVREAAEDEWTPEDLTAGPPMPVDRMEADLRDLIGTVQNDQLRELLERFFGSETERWQRFRDAPAAKHYHQAYPGGLLEHSLTVAQGVSAASALFPRINRDVAVTGALLHDFGKTEAYNDDPVAIDFTDAGRLLGEIPIGYFRVRTEMESIDGFDPELAQAISHIILSHHGSLEHGSPVVPSTREAALVHAMDNLGGTLGSFDRLQRELADGEKWSQFDRGLSASAYFGEAGE